MRRRQPRSTRTATLFPYTTLFLSDAPEPAAETPATPTPVATSQDNQARYILQAGAFGASGDAEAVKARIALLGLNARVESAVIKGKTVYRVRLGPYGNATELASAKTVGRAHGRTPGTKLHLV